MSTKKVASKETKAAEKKPAAKKTATASAAKKPAEKAAATKSASKAETKPAAKVAAQKTASKTAAKSEPKAAKTAKSVEKVAEKAAEKVTPKAAAKTSAKAKPAPVAKSAAPAKASANAAKTEVKPVEKAATKVAAEKVSVKSTEETKTAPKSESKYDYAILLEGVKKLSKSIMFIEIDEQEDRSNKKKMSSEMKNLEMKPTAAIRRKASLAEETQEELTERILKELEEQNLAFEREAATQMCTRCNRNLVSPEFWVDKHLGYCEECAAILKLGQSKEARKVEYQLGGMGDSLDEDDEDIMGPDADDLKAAEEDLAEMDD